jgi:hypothetical protein
MFPKLAGAVRDLANDNIITAVMLTGVMLLQVSRVPRQSAEGGGQSTSAECRFCRVECDDGATPTNVRSTLS